MLVGLYDSGRLRFAGREVLRAFWYRPQALQMTSPAVERRQRGVLFVPQLLLRVSHQS